MGIVTWIWQLLTWLTSPSIVPWEGVVAAIVAALTVEPKTWLKARFKSVGRALRVAVVFLIVAWMFSSVARLGSGEGDGNDFGTGKTNDNTPVTPPVKAVPGQFPSGTPKHVDLVVSFVPSAANQSVAQEFSCDLLHKGTEKEALKIEIRGRDMHDFDKLLVKQLRLVNLPEAPKRVTVLIKRSPFPGENVVRRVEDKVRTVLSNATVVFDE
ncbi:MAG: hypothetical protein NZM29_00585 [Nitrospira sp.]|nr:hypothetical protein [Nitrospira sp.]